MGCATDTNLPITGVRPIDHNRECVDAFLGRLHVAIGVTDGQSSIEDDFLREMADFVQRGLTREEDLMYVTGYPDLAVHQADHRRALLMVREFIKESAMGNPISCARLQAFFCSWREDHILSKDLPAAEYLLMKPGSRTA